MNKKMMLILVMTSMLLMAYGSSYGVSRVLEFDLAVDDSWSWSMTDEETTACDELSINKNDELTYTLTAEVTEDNGNGTFDLELTTTNVYLSEDGGQPQSQSGGSDDLTMTQGRGRWTVEPDGTLLLPGSVPSGCNMGTAAGDQTGAFITTAVDVYDTWYSSRKVTPYGESEQTVLATSELLEWTTFDGRNVAKIETIWTQPISVYDSVKGTLTAGDINVTEMMWFDYENHVVAKSITYSEGTLLVTTSESYPDNEYSIDVSSTSTQILD